MKNTNVASNPLPAPLKAGLGALEYRVMAANGASVSFDIQTGLVQPAEGPDAVDAVSKLVEVDVEDPNTPGEPILYDTLLFTATGSAKSGLRAQLKQYISSEELVIYRVQNDEQVSRLRSSVAEDGNAVLDQEHLLEPVEIEELAAQPETLNTPNDQRHIRGILK